MVFLMMCSNLVICLDYMYDIDAGFMSEKQFLKVNLDCFFVCVKALLSKRSDQQGSKM